MTNKKILLGILAITLVFGMTFIGCDEDSEGNPYIGEWSGTFTPKKNGVTGQEAGAKIIFTDTTWTLEWTSTSETPVTLNGTYTKGAINANLAIGDYNNTASASIILNKLKLTFSNGEYNGSSGDFTRVKDAPTDAFIGSWSGTFTPNGKDATTATITFTATEWTFVAGDINENGTYTKAYGYTATLKQTTYDIGTALVNPLNGSLTVTFTTGTPKGSGSGFTRSTP
jgi:hypothetical protein